MKYALNIFLSKDFGSLGYSAILTKVEFQQVYRGLMSNWVSFAMFNSFFWISGIYAVYTIACLLEKVNFKHLYYWNVSRILIKFAWHVSYVGRTLAYTTRKYMPHFQFAIADINLWKVFHGIAFYWCTNINYFIMYVLVSIYRNLYWFVYSEIIRGLFFCKRLIFIKNTTSITNVTKVSLLLINYY